MDRNGNSAEPDDRLVYKPRDVFVFRAAASCIALMVLCAPFAVIVAAHSVRGAVGWLVFYAILAAGLWVALRRRVILTRDELVVQGHLSRVRVPLAALSAVHYAKTGSRADRHRLVLWIAANGIRPFRLDFLAGRRDVVDELRRRAIARGAALEEDPDDLREAPPGTRALF